MIAFSECYTREFLISCLSLSLGIKPADIEFVLNEEKYVLTLDYVLKMLNINERRICGVPLIINGETGVGKTHLLKLLSKLWNLSLLNRLSLEQRRLLDLLERNLKEILQFHYKAKNLQSSITGDLEDYKFLFEHPMYYYDTHQEKSILKVLEIILPEECMTTKSRLDSVKSCSQFKEMLKEVLILHHPMAIGKTVSEMIVPHLLDRENEPLFEVVKFPIDIMNLFDVIRDLGTCSKIDEPEVNDRQTHTHRYIQLKYIN